MSKTIEGLKKLAERSKAAAEAKPKPIEQFFRLKCVTLPTDHFPAWQVEMVTVQGMRLLKRECITKRDLKGMGIQRVEEFIEEGGFTPDAQ